MKAHIWKSSPIARVQGWARQHSLASMCDEATAHAHGRPGDLLYTGAMQMFRDCVGVRKGEKINKLTFSQKKGHVVSLGEIR